MNALLLTAAAFLPSQPSLQIHPPAVTLTGPQATQRIIVTRLEDKTNVGDATQGAEFFSSNPKVAVIDENGVITAVGDGETNISASRDDLRASIKVKVEKTKEPTPVSFANHVIPVLTKLGCNSGACHGALAGKGGMKLSLRGYDPDADHFVLTRQAQGRRVDLARPAHSLFLLKPTMAVRHGGGDKLSVDGRDYRALSGWIAEGAVGPKDSDVHIQGLTALPAKAR